MTDYPEALGDAATAWPPREVADYLRLIKKDKGRIMPLERETALYGKGFSDVLYDIIPLHPLLVRIVDTPEFQRLRQLKQLGCTYFVFPCATHSRFEHSLGVSYLAGKLLEALAKTKSVEPEISRSETLCVQIAGLLHDLGHGPFSHMWEKFVNMSSQDGTHWEHEEMSLRMFDHLLEANKLRPVFEAFGLQEEDLHFIKELIVGWKKEGGPSARPSSRRFLFDIVANKRSGIDVDKWDYLARDGRQVKIGQFHYARFMESARVLSVQGVTEIGFRDKEMDNLYDMFRIRFDMHKRVYQHRKVKVCDVMLCDVFRLADPFFPPLRGMNNATYRPSQAHKDVVAFRKLNDNILEDIYNNVEDIPQLRPAWELIHRIKTRRTYKLLGRIQPAETVSTTEDEILGEVIKALDLFQVEPVTSQVLLENVLVIKNCINYGMGVDNPLEEVSFFRKDEPNVALRMSRPEQLPAHYQECEVLLFYRSENEEEICAAQQVVKAWADRRCLVLNNTSVRMSTMKRKHTEDSDEEKGKTSSHTARRRLPFTSPSPK